MDDPNKLVDDINKLSLQNTKKICLCCNIEKTIDEYNKNASREDGYNYYCRLCDQARKIAYYNTLNGALSTLLNNSKLSAERRRNKGRIEAGKHEIYIKDLKDLWIQQEGKCYYSGIPMNYDKHEWQMSLERLNDDLGYIKTNIALVCLELNSRYHWSHEKIQEMLNILDQNIQENIVNFELEVKEKKIPVKIIKSIINDIVHYNCTHCGEIKPFDNFLKTIKSGCQKCRSLNGEIYQSTPRGTLNRLISSANLTTETRKKKNKEKRTNEFDIDFDFIVKVFNDQKGLCAYSGIPLQFGKHTNWSISLERIDVLKGYTKDNICLICNDFQTSDNTIRHAENTGNAGWTKEKFKYFLDTLRNK
jgi:hypothetical protein